MAPKKRNISYKSMDECICWKRKQMKKKISSKIFWVMKFYHENEKEREILETLLWIFTCSYNAAIAFLYIIPYYIQKIWKIIFYGRPQFCKGMKITVFIKNKVISICCCILHSFLYSLFWFKHISCIMLSEILIV